LRAICPRAAPPRWIPWTPSAPNNPAREQNISAHDFLRRPFILFLFLPPEISNTRGVYSRPPESKLS
jgi:hypothetical protein